MDDKSIVSIWRAVITGLVFCVLAGVTSCQMTREKYIRAIEAGADPLEVRCALEGDGSSGRCAMVQIARMGR